MIGGGAQDAGQEIAELATLLQAPITTRRMGHGTVPTRHPLFVPVTVGRDLWAEADVVLGIGSRLEWPLTRWGVDPDLTLIKVDVDPDELDRHGATTVGIAGDAAEVAAALADALRGGPARADRTAEVADRRRAFEVDLDRLRPQLDHLAAIRDVLPDDGVLVEDVTQVGFAAHLGFDFRQPRTFVSSGPAGTLGAGFAMGLGAQAALPDRRVVVVAGDGGFLFTASELATAVQHDIPLVTMVFDDGAVRQRAPHPGAALRARPHDRLPPPQPRLRGLRRELRRARPSRPDDRGGPAPARAGLRPRRPGRRRGRLRTHARPLAVLPARPRPRPRPDRAAHAARRRPVTSAATEQEVVMELALEFTFEACSANPSPGAGPCGTRTHRPLIAGGVMYEVYRAT